MYRTKAHVAFVQLDVVTRSKNNHWELATHPIQRKHTYNAFPCAHRRLEAAVDDAIADKEQAQALVEAERTEVGQTTIWLA